MAEIVFPLVLIDREGWLSVFRSEQDASAAIEAPDVETGEYVAFDAGGTRVEPYTMEVEVEDLPWWRRIRQQAPVAFRGSPQEMNSERLKQILAEALGIDEDAMRSLADLVDMAAAAPTHRLRAPKSIARLHTDLS